MWNCFTVSGLVLYGRKGIVKKKTRVAFDPEEDADPGGEDYDSTGRIRGFDRKEIP